MRVVVVSWHSPRDSVKEMLTDMGRGLDLETDDGKESWLYESDGISDTCVEVADHHDDGTTTAYEHSNSVFDGLFSGGRGTKK